MTTSKTPASAAAKSPLEESPILHDAVLTAQLATVMLDLWDKGVTPGPSEMAESIAGLPPFPSGLRAHHVHELWGAALTVAKFTARVAGLPIPKGAHIQ